MDEELKRRSEMDQAIAALREFAGILPPACWKLHTEFQEQGFSESDSIQLVKTYILSMSPNGINGAK